MLKHVELSMSGSCLNKALDDERIFVLLARDPAAPAAIYAWIKERLRLGKNARDDALIREAAGCAERMDAERGEIRQKLGKRST